MTVMTSLDARPVRPEFPAPSVPMRAARSDDGDARRDPGWHDFARKILRRHDVRAGGRGERTVLFAHGYGCNQDVWQRMVSALGPDYRSVSFDYVGSGRSDLSAYDRATYATLEAHARDLIDVCDAAELVRPLLVGHSSSAMIGAIAAALRPDLLDGLVMVAPNPCYIDQADYRGGFVATDIEDLLSELERNFFAWSRMMAPVIMGNADRPELGAELANTFCANDPDIARHLARVTFLSDSRAILPRVRTRTLVLQCQDDALAPIQVGDYIAAALPRGELVHLRARGHCPHLSAPDETAAAIRRFTEQARGPA